MQKTCEDRNIGQLNAYVLLLKKTGAHKYAASSRFFAEKRNMSIYESNGKFN